MRSQLLRPCIVLLLLAFGDGALSRVTAQNRSTRLTVHEWGTFTTVAGQDGRAIDWLPLSGPTDLPCFVQHYQNNPLVKIAPGTVPLTYEEARARLWGKVRMETPVLYFYAPEPMSVGVRVQFPRGLMTEWYPAAIVKQGALSRASLGSSAAASTIEWPRVRISPSARDAFLTDIAESHYYRARPTDAATLLVNGQTEKFLFYRGVADFDVPITVEALGSAALRIRNNGSEPLPAVIVFEKRGTALGYRVLGLLSGEVTVAAPALNGSFAGLRAELEQVLTRVGLYPKEAAAMVDTWRDSWFEEGARVFYIVPPSRTDAILPLTITPAPEHIARVREAAFTRYASESSKCH